MFYLVAGQQQQSRWMQESRAYNNADRCSILLAFGHPSINTIGCSGIHLSIISLKECTQCVWDSYSLPVKMFCFSCEIKCHFVKTQLFGAMVDRSPATLRIQGSNLGLSVNCLLGRRMPKRSPDPFYVVGKDLEWWGRTTKNGLPCGIESGKSSPQRGRTRSA